MQMRGHLSISRPTLSLAFSSLRGRGGVRRRDSWKDSRQRFLEEINASYSIGGGGGGGGGEGRRSRGTKRVR